MNKLLTDIHTHSDFSFDGSEPLSSILEEAYKRGVSFYGVSEHYEYEFFIDGKNQKTLALLKNIDVLVDGQFELALRDENLLFRGSSNQRLIDVKKTLEKGEVVIYEPMNLLSPLLMKYKINA